MHSTPDTPAVRFDDSHTEYWENGKLSNREQDIYGNLMPAVISQYGSIEEYWVDGKRVDKFNKKQLVEYRRHDIGFVFQFYNLIANLTTLENIELACQLSKDALEPRVILGLVGLDHRMKNFPSQLSGGEQQRVAIARAIVNNPKLLLCDEPTGNLDPDTSWEIMKVLEKINNNGTTIMMATHDKEMVNRMKKRVLVIEAGRLKKDYEKGKYNNEAV